MRIPNRQHPDWEPSVPIRGIDLWWFFLKVVVYTIVGIGSTLCLLDAILSRIGW